MKRFRGGLVVKVPRLLFHSTLGSGAIKKKKTMHTSFGGKYSVNPSHSEIEAVSQ
jgi:hypothetical protein